MGDPSTVGGFIVSVIVDPVNLAIFGVTVGKRPFLEVSEVVPFGTEQNPPASIVMVASDFRFRTSVFDVVPSVIERCLSRAMSLADFAGAFLVVTATGLGVIWLCDVGCVELFFSSALTSAQ